jgi:L-lactate dehydrogenase
MKLTSQKIAIIGAGAVGATTAYAIMLRNLAAGIILVDVNEAKQEGEVMDISDGLCFVETGSVATGTFRDAADADIIIVTAGMAQKPGETRMDLVVKNKEVVKSIFKQVGKIKSSAIVIMVSNPVDVLTYLAQEIAGLPKNQVFGTGTNLDTARLRSAVGDHLNVNSQNVHGYVLGEHGDSEFIAWSTVTVGGLSGEGLISVGVKKEISLKVKGEAYEIINRKGATFYGIATAVADIVEAILFDQHKILPLSTRIKNWNGVSNVSIGVPAVLGRSGIERVWPVALLKEERDLFIQSAETLKKYI